RRSMDAPVVLQEPSDFSLVLGGPLYQMFRRARMTGPTLELLHRRVVFFWLLCWVPLAVLSLMEGHLWGGTKFSFLRDIETQVRLAAGRPYTSNAGRVLVCVRQRARLPVHPAALVYANPDLVLVFVAGFTSKAALAARTSRPGRWTGVHW